MRRATKVSAVLAVALLVVVAGPFASPASAAGPTITSFSPLAGSITGPTVLTINGTGFVAGAVATLERSGVVLQATGAVVAATQISNARFDTVGQPPGRYQVVVTNPDSSKATFGDGSTTGFVLVADPPTVTSVNPADGAQGASVSLQLGGSNFARQATITFPDTNVLPTDDITVTSSTWTGLQSYLVTISIPASAPLGPRDVVFKNTDTQTGVCTKCFTVKAPTPVPTPPTVKTITPGNSNDDSNKNAVGVTVTGMGFHGSGAAAPIALQLRGACPDANPCALTGRSLTATGTSVTKGQTPLQDDSLTATFDLRLAAPGSYDVVVINTDDGGSGQLARGFLVIATGAPVVTSPSAQAPIAAPGGAATTINVTGDFFAGGDAVSLSNAVGIAITNTTVLSKTQIRFTATVSDGAAAGLHDLTVAHTDGQTGGCVSCVNVTGTAASLSRPTWFLSNHVPPPAAAEVAFSYGAPGDVPVVCDWNGDGTATPGIFRNGTWFVRNSNTSGAADVSFSFGDPGDIPVCGDWNGDGVDTVGVFRGGTWFLRNSNTTGSADVSFGFGDPTDVPVTGDWNGDGVDTVGIDRNAVFFLRNGSGGGVADVGAFRFGDPGDMPVTGDYDATNTSTIGVVRP